MLCHVFILTTPLGPCQLAFIRQFVIRQNVNLDAEVEYMFCLPVDTGGRQNTQIQSFECIKHVLAPIKPFCRRQNMFFGAKTV